MIRKSSGQNRQYIMQMTTEFQQLVTCSFSIKLRHSPNTEKPPALTTFKF